MAGVTDSSYRQIIKMIAREIVLYTEFLSTDALAHGSKKTKEMLRIDPVIERPFIVQIFGKDPKHFIVACKMIEDIGADGIDINMGCPAARVVSSCHGSALMREPKLAGELVHSAVSSVRIPVSVKTRLGWENAKSLIPFCSILEQAGAAAIAVHGRTFTQKFSGISDWEPIYELKRNLKIPIIGNGDIWTVEDAKAKIGNLDGIMIGRGAMGNPWLLRDVCDALNHRKPKETPCFPETIPIILQHCRIAVLQKGEPRGIREMRKHFVKYLKGFDGAKELRMRLMAAETFRDVEEILAVRV